MKCGIRRHALSPALDHSAHSLQDDLELETMRNELLDNVKIVVVQERLNRIFGFCTIWTGALRGYETETVTAGSFDACAVRG